MTNAMENAIREARKQAINDTALELMRYIKKCTDKEQFEIAIEAAAIGITASIGGTVVENAEEIKKAIFID